MDYDKKAQECKSLKDRINYFAEHFQNGGIQTFINSEPTSKEFLVRAIIHPDVLLANRAFTGYANGTDIAAVENEALLRAFTFMGIGTFDSINEFSQKFTLDTTPDSPTASAVA